ncbi:MAG: hypothetical protein Q8J88_11300 [Bacteroidales bacterium]|nr:hypothetical protein [Bacteroidales bacterium]
MENIDKEKGKDLGGRPKKNVDLLPDHWNEAIIELYTQGGSDKEVKALINSWLGSFSNDLWDRWMKEEEGFSETIKRGKMLSEAWWEKQGRTSLTSSNFNATLWYMNMKNRFGWADSQKVDHTTAGEKINVIFERG